MNLPAFLVTLVAVSSIACISPVEDEVARADQGLLSGVTEVVWREGFGYGNYRDFRRHTAHDTNGSMRDEVLFVFNGTWSSYGADNHMVDLYQQWKGPAYYTDGPDSAGHLADDIIERMMANVYYQACTLGRTITYAGFSRGAYMAMAAFWKSRSRCNSRIRMQILLDPVDTTIHGFTNDAADNVLQIRKTAGTPDGDFNMYANGYVRCSGYCYRTLVELPIVHEQMATATAAKDRIRSYVNARMLAEQGQPALLGL